MCKMCANKMCENVNCCVECGSCSSPRTSVSTLYTWNVASADAVQRCYSDEVNGARVMTLILEIFDIAIDIGFEN